MRINIFSRIIDKIKYIVKRIFSKKRFIIAFLVMIITVAVSTSILSFHYPSINTVNLINDEDGNFELVDRESILGIVNKYLSKGFFLFDSFKVQDEISKSSPFIQKVFITKYFPSKLNVEIITYKPFLVLNNSTNCILLDSSSHVLKIEDATDGNCSSVIMYYKVVQLESSDTLVDFKVGEDSNFLLVKDIKNVEDIFKNYSIVLQNCNLKDEVLKCYVAGGKSFIFSSSQSFQEQLVRFVSVMDEITRSNVNYISLDVRYKRPVAVLKK